MDYEDNLIAPNEFDNDLHALNREIVRLAYLLKLDLTDESAIERLLSDTTLGQSKDIQSQEKLKLKGLLALRGELRKERIDSGLADGVSPLDEEAYKLLSTKKQ